MIQKNNVLGAKAEKFQVDGLYYHITSNTEPYTVEVAHGDYSSKTTIIIPETVTYNEHAYSVTSIGDWAFSDCYGLTSVTIPNSVTSIGEWAFNGCDNLTYNEYDNALYLGNNDNPYLLLVKAKSTDITECEINPKCKIIGNCAFEDCSGLKSVTIPNSVTSIGEWAFNGCDNLTYNEYDNALYLGNNDNPYLLLVKAKSTGIPTCEINSNCKIISSDAFRNCSSLKSVTIPNSVTSIGVRAFEYCSGLTSIDVDSDNSNFTSVDGVLFNKDKTILICCPAGKTGSYTIPNSVTSIGENAFCECSGLTSVTIPNSVTSIGSWAFQSCSGLTSVTIPNSVTSIGEWAFELCSGLTSVTIPNSVTSIGAWAFEFCSSLNSVKVNWEEPLSISSDVFGGLTLSDISLYVPNSVKAKYEEASVWKDFNIVGYDEPTAIKAVEA